MSKLPVPQLIHMQANHFYFATAFEEIDQVLLHSID
jgi:hypothetical protein